MSAMPSMATESVRRNEPTRWANAQADSCGAAKYLSFDHFIGSQHQASRDFVPNRLRGPEIDD